MTTEIPRASIELWSAANLIPMCMRCNKPYEPTYENGWRTSNKCETCLKTLAKQEKNA